MKVFYSDKMWAENAGAFSPSAKKPKLIIEHWQKLGLPIEIVEPQMATATDLALAHDPNYVRGVMTCKEPNGFGNRDPQVAASLPFTTGSMISAAKAALVDGVACSPTSGFHHACYPHGGGFCTFNGLMVTAIKLKNEGLVNRVGILDFDFHRGNGQEDIIDHLKIDYVDHYTQGAYHCHSKMTQKFLDSIPGIIEGMKNNGCDLLIAQLGSDPHEKDDLGGWLTSEEMRIRDRLVFETCRRLNLPLVYNHAGGYQTPVQNVIDLHTTTLKECLEVYYGNKNTALLSVENTQGQMRKRI